MPRVENPTNDRPYLLQPNYYRLSYQLSAQLLNSEHPAGQRVHGGKKRFDPNSILYGRTGPRGRSDNLTRARVEAERAMDEAEAVLQWLTSRERGLWRLLQPLDHVESRLQTFLRRTVVPCLDLIVASSLRHEDWAEAEVRVAPLRDAAERGSLSYRALYNLACFEAGSDDTLVRALALLKRALREAPEGRQRELARWAAKDPAFGQMRKAKAFDEILDEYVEEKRKR